MAVRRLFNDRHYFADVSGNNAGAGYLLGFYLAGSTTPATTYNSNLGTTPNSNPMTLDAAGRLQAEVWATTGIPLKIAYAVPGASFPFSSPVWTEDNVTVLNDVSPTNITGEWIGSGFTPTYISATSFSVPGDQTAILTQPSAVAPGRSLQIVDSAGTKYGFIKTSTFSAGVTTIVLDSSSDALVNPVSSVAYGIIQRSLRRFPVLGTEQGTTSGTSTDFTGIPSLTKRITIMFSGSSTNGTSGTLIQIGDSGGIETSGYDSSGSILTTAVSSTHTSSGFLVMNSNTNADGLSGTVTLNLENATSFTWTEHGILQRGTGPTTCVSAGSKSLSAELDRVRITMVNGTDTFDGGVINISYE